LIDLTQYRQQEKVSVSNALPLEVNRPTSRCQL